VTTTEGFTTAPATAPRRVGADLGDDQQVVPADDRARQRTSVMSVQIRNNNVGAIA
jgi:hypothetical protein